MHASRVRPTFFIALLALILCAGMALAADSQTAASTQATELVEVDQDVTSCEALVAETQALPISIVDQLRQDSCSCRDLCRSDAQCAMFYGAGSICAPTGPCGCRQCFATS